MTIAEADAVACKRDAEQRRAVLLARPDLNGIDRVEVDPSDHRILSVFFIRPVPPANAANPADTADAFGISAQPSRIAIEGGTRIVGVKTATVTRKIDADGTPYLEVVTDRPGDFSVYTLRIDGVPALDRYFSVIRFSFMAACPIDVDCRHVVPCEPRLLTEPLLDYMAKDYASFRRMLLDLLPQLNPGWVERNPSDLGMALLELLAYEGDRLSYFQDAVANEAYLETVRHRISARRHARLIDYRMHDGRNAWTYVHLGVNAACTLAQGTKMVTRIVAPLVGAVVAPDREMDDAAITVEALGTDPALASAVVFEAAHGAALDPSNNEIMIHAWGNDDCCLPAGITEAYLFAAPNGVNVVRPAIAAGDALLFEEVRDPLRGVESMADRTHRQVVMVTNVQNTDDPLFQTTLLDGELRPSAPGDPALPLLRVQWGRGDALRFPLCLSARRPDVGLIRNVSVARGNLVLADHGLTTSETINLGIPLDAGPGYRLGLSRGPLTLECEPDDLAYDPTTARPNVERRDLSCSPREARPAVAVLATFPGEVELWTPVPDLLDSTPFDTSFVAEIDDDGRAILRFGDAEYGRMIDGATGFAAVYRVGNGRAGNVGHDSLFHVALPGGSSATGRIETVRNPIAATGGVDAETIEEVRRLAPDAFRAEQFRAVTEADYRAAALKRPEVSGAVAAFRWTGSWYTVFVGIDPTDPSDVETGPTGLPRLRPAFERLIRAQLTRYRLAGYDLELRPPRFAPVELDLDVCVSGGHFRGDVLRAIRDAMGNRTLPGGRLGFFHPSNFTFGQAVYASRIYAAVEAVEGVDSLVIIRFRRYGQVDNGELETGRLPIGPWEIAQLDNDPNFLEHGVLRLTVRGGKG
jgi:hypothetical protein